jgi:WD40 repeat protein
MASEGNQKKIDLAADSVAIPIASDVDPIDTIVHGDTSDDELGEEADNTSESSEEGPQPEIPSESSTAPEQLFAAILETSEEPPIPLSESNTKKQRKSAMTRLQENELLLSIYDALSAYRRPSSKLSLTRKLDAIDNAQALLQNLREQLLQTEEIEKSSKPDATPSRSAAPIEGQKKTPKESKKAVQAPVDGKKKATKQISPKTPFALYCLEYRDELLKVDPKATAAHIKSQCDVAWKALAPARQEIYISRFSRLYEPQPPFIYQPRNMTDLVEHHRTMVVPSSADASIKLPTFLDPHSVASGASNPSSDVMPWKLSPNPRFKGTDSGIEGLRLLTSLKSPSSNFTSMSVSGNGCTLALSTGSKAYLYEMDPSVWENGLTNSKGNSSVTTPSSSSSDVERCGIKFLAAVEATSEPMTLSRTICLNFDGSSFYSVDADRHLRKWNTQTKKLELEVKTHDESVLALAISNCANLLATASSDRHVMIWDASTLAPLKRLGSNGNKKLGPTDGVVCVAFSPNGMHLACGSVDHQIRVWNVNSGVLEARFDGHDKPVVSIAWANETDLISTSLDSTIKSWSIKASHHSHCFRANLADVSITSSFDRSEILWTGGKDKFLKYWLPSFSYPSNPPSNEIADPLVSSEPRGIVVAHTSSIIDISCTPLSPLTTTLMASLATDGICAIWLYHSPSKQSD